MTSFDSLVAMQAYDAEMLKADLERNDLDGAFARAHEISKKFTEWHMAELQRVGPRQAIEAALQVIALLLHDQADSIAANNGRPPQAMLVALTKRVYDLATQRMQDGIEGCTTSVQVPGP